MKFNQWTLTLAALASAALIITGCASSPINAQTEQAIVTTAAAYAVQTDINSHPADAPLFADGAILLSDLAGGSSTLTVPQVQAILAATGQTNQAAALITPLAVNLINSYAQSNGTNSVPLNATTKQLLGYIATGIGQGVAASGK